MVLAELARDLQRMDTVHSMSVIVALSRSRAGNQCRRERPLALKSRV